MRIWVNFDKKTALGGNKGKNLGGGRKGGGRREEGGREEGGKGEGGGRRGTPFHPHISK